MWLATMEKSGETSMKHMCAAFLLSVALLVPYAAVAQAQHPARPAVEQTDAVRPRVMIVRVFTTDIERSERFYRAVFGFGAPQSFGPGNRMFGMPSPTAPSILLVQVQQARANGAFTLAVNDTAAVLAAAAANGGTV